MLYMPQSLKRCAKCGEWKPITSAYFYWKEGQPYAPCKLCYKGQGKARRSTQATPKSSGWLVAKCERCGKKFEVRNSKFGAIKFCSKSCRFPITIKTRCERCGKEFDCATGSVRRFCSDECRRPPQIVKCERCGKEFRRKPSDLTHRFCSVACRTSSEMVRCERCGKEFRIFASAIVKHSHHYCSNECRAKPAVIVNCERCGKPLYRPPGAPNRRFCSQTCFRRSAGETSIERKVRLTLEEIGVEFSQEHKAGKYHIDFVVINARLAIEADGEYWHRDEAQDRRRDEYLRHEGWTVCRLPEELINTHPNLAAYLRDLITQHTPQ